MLRPATLLLVLLASSLAHATFIGSPLLGPYVQDSLASQPKAINSTTSLLGSTVDALISAKYGSATAVAWRRLVSGGGSVDAVAGPVLGGDIVCYVGPDGGVAGLRYGPALVCDATADAVTVSVGEGFVERVDIYLGASAKIAGLVFVVHPPSSYEPSVAYPCGTTKGPHAWIGERGKAVGALAGGCTTPSRRRALLQSSNGTLSAAGFKAVLVPAPPPGTPSSGGYGNGNFTF